MEIYDRGNDSVAPVDSETFTEIHASVFKEVDNSEVERISAPKPKHWFPVVPEKDDIIDQDAKQRPHEKSNFRILQNLFTKRDAPIHSKKVRNVISELSEREGYSPETFYNAVDLFKTMSDAVRGKASIIFIYSALGRMREFGVVSDMDAYKELMSIFPIGESTFLKIVKRNVMLFVINDNVSCRAFCSHKLLGCRIFSQV